MMEKVILFIAERKMLIDSLVLLFLLLVQWPLFLINVMKEKKGEDGIETDHFLSGLFFLFGLYALSYRIIDIAYEAILAKGKLSLSGEIFSFLAVSVYFFITYLFVSMFIYSIYLFIEGKRQAKNNRSLI